MNWQLLGHRTPIIALRFPSPPSFPAERCANAVAGVPRRFRWQMLMGSGEWEMRGMREMRGITNAQCPMPNYDMSIFSFFFFLKGTRIKL
jgi:hypothetical protein